MTVIAIKEDEVILPFSVAVKDFFGIFVITPFEKRLLSALSEALTPENREILKFQLSNFNAVRRLIKHLDEPNAHGFTNFHTLRFGKDVSDKAQVKKFHVSEPEYKLATANMTFAEGEIEASFWLVNGVFFTIDYRSPQKIYYPSEPYKIGDMKVHLPQGGNDALLIK